MTPTAMRRIAALLAPAVALLTPAAVAQVPPPEPEVRLVVPGGFPDGTYRLGISIALAPGWKTYWRYPGHAGLAPRFDFSGSGNVGAVTVALPGPDRFFDGFGWSIGYQGTVVFPVMVTPADPAQPVRISATLDYGYCLNVCIPASATVFTLLTPADGIDPASVLAVNAAARRVPVPEREGLLPAVTGFMPEADGAWRIELALPPDAGAVDVFAEGPDELWRLPLPEPVVLEPGRAVFRLPITGVPRDTDPAGAAITLTVVTAAQSVEAVRILDVPRPGD